MIDALTGEITAEQQQLLNEHLQTCASCRTDYEHILFANQFTRNYTRPAVTADFWQKSLDDLQAALNQRPKTRLAFSLRFKPQPAKISPERFFKPIIAVTALCIILCSAFYHFSKKPDQVINDKTFTSDFKNIQNQAMRCLEQSKLLLLGFSNYDQEELPPSPALSEKQVQMSRELITRVSALQNDLDPVAQKKLVQLLSDLEVILLQIANLDSLHDTRSIEIIQHSVDRKSILFKINMEELQLLDEKLESAELKTSKKKEI